MGRVEWILISSFGDTSERRVGIQTIDPTVKPFDERVFPWKWEGSGLVNIMMVEWFGEVAERLIVAQIHRRAWEEAGPEWRHIRFS